MRGRKKNSIILPRPMSKIISAPNPVLSLTAEKFVFGKNDVSLKTLLRGMEKALLSASDPKGVGLAAPQIGKSVAIFMAKPTEQSKISVFINPEIVETGEISSQKQKSTSRKPVRKLEGCLSLPSIWGEVLRAPSVTLEYQTPSGRKQFRKFTGFMAIIVQHEVDHLGGILFPKRVLEQKGKLYKSSKNEKGEDEFEEISV